MRLEPRRAVPQNAHEDPLHGSGSLVRLVYSYSCDVPKDIAELRTRPLLRSSKLVN